MNVLANKLHERHSLTFLSGFSVLLALYDLFLGANKDGWLDGCIGLYFTKLGRFRHVGITINQSINAFISG